MGRLIDLDEAIDAVSNLACSMSVCLSKEEALGMRNMRDRVVKVLNTMPSAQPEIIRCKDCRHNQDCDIQYDAQAGEEFYCGAAERRLDA